MEELEDFELPESPDEFDDPFFDVSEVPDELSDDDSLDPLDPLDPFDPLAPLAELSLAAGTVLAPFRLSVR